MEGWCVAKTEVGHTDRVGLFRNFIEGTLRFCLVTCTQEVTSTKSFAGCTSLLVSLLFQQVFPDLNLNRETTIHIWLVPRQNSMCCGNKWELQLICRFVA